MPSKSPGGSLGAFLKALKEAEIRCILIGMMAAVKQGAPLTTIDYDFWIDLPERQYVRLLSIIQRLGGAVLARTLYELADGTQVNSVFKPNGLNSFAAEYRGCSTGTLDGEAVRVLPLKRVIASKRAAGREKDLAALPVLERTLRLSRRLKAKKRPQRRR